MRPPREPSESRSHDSSGAPLGGIVGLTMLERGYEFRCVAFIVAQWFSSALFTDDPNCLSTTSEWECKCHATVRISSWLATGRMGTPKTTQKVDGRLRLEVHPGLHYEVLRVAHESSRSWLRFPQRIRYTNSRTPTSRESSLLNVGPSTFSPVEMAEPHECLSWSGKNPNLYVCVN